VKEFYLGGAGAFFSISDLSLSYISFVSALGTAGDEEFQSIGNFVILGLSANMKRTTFGKSTTEGGFSNKRGSS